MEKKLNLLKSDKHRKRAGSKDLDPRVLSADIESLNKCRELLLQGMDCDITHLLNDFDESVNSSMICPFRNFLDRMKLTQAVAKCSKGCREMF